MGLDRSAAVTTVGAAAHELKNPGDTAGGGVGGVGIKERHPVEHFLVGQHDVVAKAEVEGEAAVHFEVILDPPGVSSVAGTGADDGIFGDAGVVDGTEEIAGVGIACGGE